MITIKIDTNNAAFADGGQNEIARILRELADKVEERGTPGGTKAAIMDINGNKVGYFTEKE